MNQESVDFLVVGSGLAGLTFALRAAEHGTVVVLTKAQMSESNTSYAQGGIAAAVGEADSWKLHEEDTLVAGAGLCDPKAVRYLVQLAPAAIQWLIQIGTRFDVQPDGDFALGREGGHSRNRILHHLDKTGWEVERAMIAAVRNHPSIHIYEHAFVTSLLTDKGRCVGAQAIIGDLGERRFDARATMLTTGGCGRVYQHTTNPSVATGDGIGLAHSVGAEIRNMEFMQFHPTTLYHPQMRSFLISEAVRGAGATLRNHHGHRFMYDYDPRLELAPRDVVARAIEAEMKRLGTWCVYLDVAHMAGEKVRDEFPTIYEKLASINIKMDRDWVPVVPAQHYSCGGVATDLDGRTSVAALYAAGEVASTGVHGANRLASNSLLEAIVFASAAAEACQRDPLPEGHGKPKTWKCIPEAESIRIRGALQRTMTAHAGIVRHTAELKQALETIENLIHEYDGQLQAPFSPHPLETHNLLVTGRYVVKAALARKMNVGLHFNQDLVNAETRRTSGSQKQATGGNPPAKQAPVRTRRRPSA